MLGAHCVTDSNSASYHYIQTAMGLCVFILWSETTQPEPITALTVFLIP